MATVKTLTPQQIAELETAAQRVAAGQAGSATTNNAGDIANLAFAKSQYGWTPTTNNNTNNQTVDTTNNTGDVETPADTFSGLISPDISTDLSGAEKTYLETQKELTETIDEDTIRAKKLEEIQKEIDALNEVYATEYARARQAGFGRLGQSTAIQARRGLLGSDFGSAQTETVNQANEAVVREIDAEKAAKISALYSKASSAAAEEIAAKKQARIEGAKALVEYYKSADDRKQKRISETATNILNSGQELTDSQFAELAKTLGTTTDILKSTYNQLKQTTEEKTAKSASDNIVESNGLFYKYNSTTGKMEEVGGTAEEQSITDKYGTGVIGEYNYYAENEKGAGRTPVSFNDYQNADANRKIAIQKAGIAGVDSNTASFALKIADRFDSNAIVKNFAKLSEAKNLVDSLSNTTKNPADDQALIYAFAKAMDPDSVVREGEYATVQKYSQSWVKSYGKGILQAISGTGFLSQEARENIKKTIKSKYNSGKVNYDNLKNETSNTMNQISPGLSNIFLKDYNIEGKKTIEDYRSEFPKATDDELNALMKEEQDFNQVGGDTNKPTAMRTDRHNNPTAFTSDIAKLAGLKEGVDYMVGDKFPNGNLTTAKLLKDPVATTIKVIDKIGFTTASGKPRWTYINMPKSQWDSLSYEGKKQVIETMYKKEGGTQLNNLFA